MPWVDENKCNGCGICVEECPVNAISMENQKAQIDMDKCIHCGICHQVCPQKAVKHDSEKIPNEIKENMQKTEKFMDACEKHLGDTKEADKCLSRMIKHFNKEKVVAEKTLEELKKLKITREKQTE